MTTCGTSRSVAQIRLWSVYREIWIRDIRTSACMYRISTRTLCTGRSAPVTFTTQMADLALATANPSMDLMQANVLLADSIPSLRIIMDHLPSFDPTPDGQRAYEAVVKEMADRPNIFVKLSEVYHPRLLDGVIVKDYEPLRARLEYLYGIFGEDRVIFGSDYPNSYGVATIPEEVGLMKRFFSTKSREAAEKYFWKNSAQVYKWTKRTNDQPSLS
jgi:L-fuconolactonase